MKLTSLWLGEGDYAEIVGDDAGYAADGSFTVSLWATRPDCNIYGRSDRSLQAAALPVPLQSHAAEHSPGRATPGRSGSSRTRSPTRSPGWASIRRASTPPITSSPASPWPTSTPSLTTPDPEHLFRIWTIDLLAAVPYGGFLSPALGSGSEHLGAGLHRERRALDRGPTGPRQERAPQPTAPGVPANIDRLATMLVSDTRQKSRVHTPRQVRVYLSDDDGTDAQFDIPLNSAAQRGSSLTREWVHLAVSVGVGENRTGVQVARAGWNRPRLGNQPVANRNQLCFRTSPT
jgi:hypothetical protein